MMAGMGPTPQQIQQQRLISRQQMLLQQQQQQAQQQPQQQVRNTKNLSHSTIFGQTK